jgi:hypothetical protein
MRTSLLALALPLLGLAVTNGACGGVTTLPAGDDAGSGTDAAGSGADAAPDSGAGNDSGSGDDGPSSDAGVDCPTMSTQLEQLEEQAAKCCPTCDLVQCTVSLPGVCCSISVNSANSQASKDYEALLKVFLQQCHPECPAILCPKSPSFSCGATGECVP